VLGRSGSSTGKCGTKDGTKGIADGGIGLALTELTEELEGGNPGGGPVFQTPFPT